MRECPYCREFLDPGEDAAYLFHWCQEEDGSYENDEYRDLKELLKEYVPASDERRRRRFERVWKNYNYGSAEELLFQPQDMILSAEEIRMIQRWIREGLRSEPRQEPQDHELILKPGRRVNADLLRQGREPAVSENGGSGSAPGISGKGQGHKNYFCLPRNERDPMDCQMDIACGVRDHIIVKIRRVCPHCFNLIPDDLYRYDILKVYLAAIPWSGKTSMLYSVYRHKDTFNRVNGGKIRWEPIQDETVDPYYALFVREAELFETVDRNLPPTLVKFIPPLFLKFTCGTGEEQETVILALYDNGGEIFLTHDSSSEAQEFGSTFNQKIRGMDALLCLLPLTEKDEVRSDDRYSLGLSEEKKGQVLRQCKVLSGKEQRMIEENPLEPEITIEELLLRMSGSNVGAGAGSRDILRTLARELGSADMAEIVRDKYLSVVVTKIDKMIYSTLFQEKEKGLLFGEEEAYFTESYRNKKGERDKIMKILLEGGRIPGGQGLLAYDIHKFRECAFHFIAAYRENESTLHPIRVEEPLVYLVSDYLVRKKQDGEYRI